MPFIHIEEKESRSVAIDVTDEIASKVAEFRKLRKCLSCNAISPRGKRYIKCNCSKCYQSQNYAIKIGVTTVRKLVKGGLRAGDGVTGRPPRSEFRKRLAEL